MSAIERIKAQIRAQNAVRRYGAGQEHQNPAYGHGANEIIVLPAKPAKKRKLLEVQKEAKASLARIPSNSSFALPTKKEDELDDEEMGEDEDEDNEKPRHVPWGPSELLTHLDNPEIVSDLNRVIQLVKQKELDVPVTDEERRAGNKKEKKKEIIVWDHSKTKLGKESDNNFFLWLEAYAAGEDKICQQQENMMFS